MISKTLIAQSTAACGTALLAAGTIHRLRDKARIKPFPKRDISGQTVLVTGGTTGIGHCIVKGLASSGAKIITAAPDLQRGSEVIEELRELGAIEPAFVHLNLQQKSSINQCSKEVLEASEGNLSMIINNAGMMNGDGNTVEGLEKVLSTNILGPFLLNMLLLPEVLANSSRFPGRIIQVGSRAERGGKPDLDAIKSSGFSRAFDSGYDASNAYADSKVALLWFTRELNRRLDIAGSDVKSVCVTPGMVYTGIMPANMSWTVAAIYPLYRVFSRTTEEGAHGILHAALAPDIQGGSYTFDGEVCNQSEISKDPELAKGFWEVSRSLMCPDIELPV